VPFVLNVHDLFPHTAIDLGLLKNKFLIDFFIKLEKYLYKTSDWVSVHSPGNREFVIKMGANPDRTIVMPVWMDAAKLTPGPKDNSWCRRYGLKGKFVVIFAGTQGYNQDMEVILKSADLLRHVDSIKFVMIGDGAQHNNMVSMSKAMKLTNVLWLDWQPRDDFPLIMQTADVVLASLKKEVGTPVVPSKILSAMSAGRPVVASMPLNGDAPKLVGKANAGLTVPPGEPVLLKEAIYKLYENHKLAEKLGANGRRYVEDYLDVKIWAKEYIALFSKLIEEGNKSWATPVRIGEGIHSPFFKIDRGRK